jgi:cell division transport system permease protein
MRYIADRFNFVGSLLTFVPVNTVFRTLIPIGLVLGVGIGFVGSKMTVRKHLRV